MRYGLTMPTRGDLATRDTIERMARRAEELGYHYLAFSDHLVIPRAIDSRYPYNESGSFPGQSLGECMEELTLMAYVAAITREIGLLTSVMVVPYRKPVHTAKIISTLDVLSGGRFILGVGAGWMEEEFEALDSPPFAERGRVTDEYIEAFKELWTSDAPSYEGRHVRFSDIVFLPKPARKPHPPIWVGGESGPALRRTVRLGDAWYPIGSNPRHPLNTVERMRGGLDRLRAAAEKEGRDPATIDTVYAANWYREDSEIELDDGQRHLLTGSDAQVAEDLGALAGLGVGDVLLNFQRDDPESTLAAMQRFAESVRPQVG